MAESTQGSRQTLRAPDAGQSVVVVAVPGQDIVLDAAFDQAEPKASDNGVVFEFANGGQVVIDFSDLGAAQAPNIVLSDGTVLNVQEFLASLGEGEVEPAAGPEGGGTGSGGVGQYRDDAGNLIDGVDKLSGLDPRDFSSITVEGLEASGSIPTLLGPDGVLVEDEALFPEGNNEDEGGVGVISGTIVDNVDWGADGFGGVNGFTVGGASFSAGSTVFWGQDGTFLGTSGVGGAASLLVNADGTYDFGLIDNMLLGQGVQGEQIDVLGTVQIIGADSSGDTVAVPLTLSVQDDVPVLLGGSSRPDEPADNDVPDYDGDEPVAFAASAAQPAPGENGNTLVNGLGGPRGFGENFLPANDDSYTDAVDVSSVFPDGMNFFGTVYNQIYINNNGNITFAAPQSTYTPSAITGTTSNPMIAPFFADVDTRGADGNVSPGGNSTGSNLVWYDLDSTNGVLTVTWDDVGYYSSASDKVNAFQLRIFDQGDGNFSFEFRYENVDWTTGNASGGSGGLGGIVARAGWTAGDGVNFYELPQSGNQAEILGLETTSNPSTPMDGNWVFNVVGGVISTGEGADIATVEDESIPDSIAGITNETDDNGVGSFVQNIRDNVSWGADGFGEVVEFHVQSETFAAGEMVFWAQDGSFLGAATEPPEGAAAYLLVKADGDYEFTLIDNMLMGNDPQLPGEQIDFLDTVEIVGADADGDTVTVNVTLNVQDDVPVVLEEASVNVTVDEDDIKTGLSDGNHPNDGDHDGSFTGDPDKWWDSGPANVEGSLASLVAFGADGPGENGFSLSEDVSALEAQNLHSKEELLSYRVVGSTLIAYVGEGEPEGPGGDEVQVARAMISMPEERIVFTLELDSDGHYRFNLYDQLDHPTGEGQNNLPIDLASLIVATDGDGDSIALTSGFTINVTDDVPEQDGLFPVLEVVEEEMLPGGNPEGYDGFPNWPDTTVATGSLASQVSFGADEEGKFSLLQDITDLPLPELTSGGTEVIYQVDGNVLTAMAGETPIFTFVLQEDGHFSFTLQGPLDHTSGGGENLLLLNLSSIIHATDADGDSITLDNDFYIKVVDDVPIISVRASGESGFLLTTEDMNTIDSSDTDSRDFSAVFTSTVKPGADGLQALGTMNYALNLAHPGVKNSGLDSDGANINLYKIGGDIVGSTSSTKAGVLPDNTVFRLEVDGNGVVKLTQYQEIDHAAPGSSSGYSSQLAVLGNNLVKLSAWQTLTDGDGDTDTDSATIDLGGNIRFADDGPSGYDETSATLDDEGLANGIPGGLGDVPGEPIVATGTLAHNFGADGAGSISFASMHGATGTVGVETVTYSWDSATNTLLATGDRGPLFEVKVTNPATGEYQVTLLDNVLHEAGGTLAVNVDNYAALAGVVTVGVLVPGDPDASLINNGGAFGIRSDVDGGSGGRFNEINYDLTGNPTGSEVMVFQLQGERIASSAVVDMTLFFGHETGVGNEVGSYELWLDGVKVQDAVAFQANSGTGNYQLAISGPDGGFDEIRFAALPGTSPTGNDDSDYSIKQVAFDLSYENDANVALTYTVTDGDGDTDEGTLRLVIDDDMPLAVNKIAGSPQPVESFKAGNLEAGWVADPVSELFDPKIDNKYDPDGDGDYQKIDWGDSGGRSSYEFLDNTDLQGTDPLDLGLGTFDVGTFVHNNYPITSGSGISTAHLNVSFDIIIAGQTVNVDHTIKFNHNETPNPAADIVTIVDGTHEVEVVVGGLKYVLELGFKSGDDIVTEITTTEDGRTEVPLVAELLLAPYLDLEGQVEVNYGADGPGSLNWVGVDDDGFIDGEYGVLEVDNLGNYEYTLNEGTSVPDGAFETFNYTVTDADGDSATSSLTIMLEYKGEIG